MATKRMLVDATHPEETRIVVTQGNKLEEFDFESANRRQLRGNIYLAKVTRVEPSLQAAFVDYGGNRHGFLAFSEIHPDYYQIPVADREALLQAEAEANAQSAEEATREADDSASDNGQSEGDEAETVTEPAPSVDDMGGGENEDLQDRRRQLIRKYKIQEVIKRRQVMLVQVVKEERGNKGAALTTYLSLAGRYSVLMPNTARGGGISRKITSASDRKRLKEIASGLDVPTGMGVILRTAGASRTKAEVKRDFEYLSRLWESVRQFTMSSTAPCLVYEEGSLIKRTIRDLYDKDIGEILVGGDTAYKEAKDFMKLIMPSHAKKVKQYKEETQIFTKYNVESQLDSMFSPQVTLPSGGYIVINPTEALVSIDVNSGRATREHNIEDTALQTNLEAADEVARQLRLRDLAGLIVIDFIDMVERRSIRNVEKRLKDALKNDRARIQVGRISHFGLLEMSRQRMRFGVLESSTHTCPVCMGSGIVRSVESLALMVMRAVEDHVVRKPDQSIEVRVPSDVALYLLNAKRNTLIELEVRHGLSITVSADDSLTGSHYSIDKAAPRPGQPARPAIGVDSAPAAAVVEETEDETDEVESSEKSGARRKRRGRRNTGGNEQQAERQTDNDNDENGQADSDADSDGESADAGQSGQSANDEDGQPRKRRRRGRRGGRRNRRSNQNGDNQGNDAQNADSRDQSDDNRDASGDGNGDKIGNGPDAAANDDGQDSADTAAVASDSADAMAAVEGGSAETVTSEPKKPRRSRRKKADKAEDAATDDKAQAPGDGEDGEARAEVEETDSTSQNPRIETAAEDLDDGHAENEKPKSKPKRRRSKKAAADADAAEGDGKTEKAEKSQADDGASEDTGSKAEPADKDEPAAEEGVIVTSSSSEPDKKPKRAGWWQRRFGR